MRNRGTREKQEKPLTILRREKRDPDADAVHTLILGVPVAVVLYLLLPPLFHWIVGLPW